MNDVTQPAQTGPRFLIAVYGLEGIGAMALLADSASQPASKRNNHTTYINLDQTRSFRHMPGYLEGIDRVFILGSDDGITAPPSALELALQCREKNIGCFTMLSISNPSEQMDVATESLCNLASNALLLPFNRPVDNLTSCNLLKAAVATIMDPLLIRGMVGVDIQDVEDWLKQGKRVHFSLATAKGAHRATEAAELAIRRMPAIQDAVAIIGTITCGSDLSIEEYSAIRNNIHAAANSECLVSTLTTAHEEFPGEIQLTLMCVMRE